mgnify:CR=1 FL=1
MKKKLMSTLLCAAMATSMLAGCGSSAPADTAAGAPAVEEEVGSEGSSEATEKTGNKLADGDVTLTIFCNLQDGARAYHTDLSDNPVVQWIEKDTGLNLEFVHAPSGDDGSFFQQMLASGEIPDIMVTNLIHNNYPGGVEGAIEDGLLYDVTELVEEYAENFWDMCELKVGDDYQKKIRGDGGKIIKFGTSMMPVSTGNNPFLGVVVRKDWLEKYGLEAPVTLEEYTEVLRTFKENGVETPLALYKLSESSWTGSNAFASAFDVSLGDFNVDADGKVYYSRTQDGYKEFLKLLNGWAKEGLIDADMVSRSADDASKLFANGSAGMTICHTYSIKEMTTTGPAIDPEFKMLPLVYPRVEKDDVLHMTSYVTSVNAQSWLVSADTADPELVVKFIDYIASPEIQRLCAFGTNEEVETWQEDDKGVRSFTEFITNNPEGLDYTTVRALYTCEPFQMAWDEDLEFAQYNVEECLASWENWKNANDGDYVLPKYLTLSVEESQEITKIKQKIANYSDEMVYNFIFGEADIDKEWDGFVTELNNLGAEEAATIYQAAVDRYNARGQEEAE